MITVEDFLSAVLPTQGNYIFLGKADTLFQRPVASIRDLVGVARWADNHGLNAFFAVSSYGELQRTKKDGTSEISRLADNSILHRSLRIDVDCGEGKPYLTQDAGVAALWAFVQQTGLPEPIIVDSGAGLHVYWPFQVDVPTDTWLTLAGKLAGAAQQLQFHLDPSATVDASRVLRVPETHNRKYAQPLPVRVVYRPSTAPDLRRIAQCLSSYPTLLLAPGQRNTLGLTGALPEALRGLQTNALGGERPPYKLRGVIAQCPGMTAMYLTHGRNASEPLWKLTLDLVNKSDESEDGKFRIAQALSDGHPKYSFGEFAQKWSQVQAQDNEPARCDKFAQIGMPECATCPLRRPGMSPVVLGRDQPQRVVLAADGSAIAAPSAVMAPSPQPPVFGTPTAAAPGALHTGVFRAQPGATRIDLVDGVISPGLSIRENYPCHSVKVSEGSDGNAVFGDKRIGNYKWHGVERLVRFEGSAESSLVLHVERSMDGLVEVPLSTNDIQDPRTMAKIFAAHGCYYTPADIKLLQERFMVSFLNALQQTRRASQLASRNGWSQDYSTFLLGQRLFTKTAVEEVRTGDAAEEMAGYHAAGDEARWLAAFNLAIGSQPERQALAALAIAAPLMAFTGIEGVLFNTYSPESGVGKSTLCNAALSIWGSPNALRKDFRDTNASLFRAAAITGNLPMVVDEFTNVAGQALSDYVYGVTQGREKTRMRADQTVRRPTERWCLPIITTSNNSVHDKLQQYRTDGQGEVARVFEMRLRPLQVSTEELTQAQRLLPDLLTNYGFLGPRIAQLLVRQDSEHWRRVVGEAIQWWTERMSAVATDRFRASTAALISIGARIGQALGLPFDVAGIVREVEQHWTFQVQAIAREQMTPESYLEDYLREYWGDMALFGGTTGDNQLRPQRGAYVGEVRYEPETAGKRPRISQILIPKSVVKSFIRERHGSYASFLEWVDREVRDGSNIVLRSAKMRALRGAGGPALDLLELSPRILGTLALQDSRPRVDDDAQTA